MSHPWFVYGCPCAADGLSVVCPPLSFGFPVDCRPWIAHVLSVSCLQCADAMSVD